MGSLSSRPSIPAPQPIITAPAPVSTPAPLSSPEQDSQSAQETATQSRTRSLLGRERSRFGTVLTSFRGLLSQNNTAGQRKTLLGE